MTDDLKERLSRLADRATDQGGEPLERLHQRRARKDRTRRVGTIALALTVAVAGSWGAFAAFAGRDDDRTAIGDQGPSGVASWQPPEVLTVWPENPVRGPSPEEAQATVDTGDESLAWRLDPEQVAERFAREFLAWNQVTVLDPKTGDVIERGLRSFGISPCTPGTECLVEGPVPILALTQPVTSGDGGIWSVASVQSEALAIGVPSLDPATGLVGGTTIALNLSVPEARSAHIGVVARNGCSEIASLEPGLDSGRHTITLPEPEPAAEGDSSCGVIGAGFVFAYAQDDTTVPVGDPLLEPAAIEYPWLTIVPLYVEMIRDGMASATPSGDDEPRVTDRLAISCDGEMIAVTEGSEVVAQVDGVHVSVQNATDVAIVVVFNEAGERFELAPGAHEIVTSSPPGSEMVSCRARGLEGRSASFQIVDAYGAWTSTETECEGPGWSQINDYASVPEGDPDSLAVGGEALEPWRQPGDELRFGGYIDSDRRNVVVLVRDGKVIGAAYLSRGTAGWYAPSLSGCDRS